MKLVERRRVAVYFTREDVEQILRRTAATLRPDLEPAEVEFAFPEDACFASVMFAPRRTEQEGEAVPTAVEVEHASPDGIRR